MNNRLVTLSRDGTVISTLTDCQFRFRTLDDLHVTEIGQVLVCGYSSVAQVNREGRNILAQVVKYKMMMELIRKPTYFSGTPTYVYYSRNTDSLIVGMTSGVYAFAE
ncbi:hypothetical protein DPMN_163217 [Dreissena polymorpha]|uniref:Uncharacterized protein n=1 Tax=Dreissena polymorpha TaxID=45954 RepID=A0A9D4EWC4_DREPO|nr:hypothetical protein DPMN_163217 [Dreissena polymorpha]